MGVLKVHDQGNVVRGSSGGGGVLPPGVEVLLVAKWVGGAVGRTTDGVVG